MKLLHLALLIAAFMHSLRVYSQLGTTFVAEDNSGNLLRYTITSSKTVQVNGCDRYSDGIVIIPDHIEFLGKSYIVNEIFTNYNGWDAERISKNKSGHTSYILLNEITIPHTIEGIPDRTFSGCNNLSKVTFPRLLKRIGSRAFYGCSSLKEIKFPNSTEYIGDYCFSGCIGLTSIEMPPNVKYIGCSCFSSCNNLKAVGLLCEVEQLLPKLFEDCMHLKSVVLPANIEVIHENCFSGCSILENIIGLNDSVLIMGNPFPKKLQIVNGFDYGKYKNSIDYELANIIPLYIKWQSKGILESSTSYNTRMTTEMQKQKSKRIIINTINNYASKHLKARIVHYNEEQEIFIINTNYGTINISVPYKQHFAFENNFETASKDASCIYVDKKLFLYSMEVNFGNCSYKAKNEELDSLQSFDYVYLPQLDYLIKKTNTDYDLTNSANKSNNQALITGDNPIAEEDEIDTDIPQINEINDNIFAVIISNETYMEDGVSDVEYAINDGNIFKKYCIQTLGIPEKNIHYRTNATLNQMRSDINWMTNIAEAYKGRASFIIYYSGHGIPDEQTASSFLLPVDGLPYNTKSAYALTDLYEELSIISAQKIIVFLDACFSGAQRNGNMLFTSRGVVIKAKSAMPKGKVVTMSAAQSNQTALAYKEKRHGVFTYFLLKKIQESKGTTTLGDLASYLCDNVSIFSSVELRKKQNPQINISTSLDNTWSTLGLK